MDTPTRLPAAPTPLIGREQEVAIACERLGRAEVRLLTITGTGGTGKTRLALRVAELLQDGFAHGALFVDLSPVREPAFVWPTIAHAARVHEAGERPVRELLQRALAYQELLLVLDNFEQVLPAAAEVAVLLEACPRVKVLATSRAPLRLRWEHEFPVQPLGVPQAHTKQDPAGLAEVPAVQLFVQRAQAMRPTFALSEENAPAVAEICRRLDGLPLAIELAAARLRVMSPAGLLARLEKRLDLLAGRTPDAPARHQTLRMALDWSHDLLAPAERAIFRRLAIFAGGASLDAITSVCAIEDQDGSEDAPGQPAFSKAVAWPTEELVASLVDKSLLNAEFTPNGEPRFRMLETVAAYAQEQLEESGEAERLHRSHAAYFLREAERRQADVYGAGQAAAVAWCAVEDHNLRAAVQWAFGAGEPGGPRLAAALWEYWFMTGRLTEGRAWLREALGRPTVLAPNARVRALHGAAALARRQCDFEMAEQLGGEALALARELDDRAMIAQTLEVLALTALARGERSRTRALLEEALSITRSLGLQLSEAWELDHLAVVAAEDGEPVRARELHELALSLRRAIGDQWGAAESLVRLSHLAIRSGELTEAEALLAEGLTIAKSLGDRLGIARGLEEAAELALARGQHARAARLFGAAEALQEEVGLGRPAGVRALCGVAVQVARGMRVDSTFARAWEEGRRLSLPEALAYARTAEVVSSREAGVLSPSTSRGTPFQPLPADGTPAGPLSRREREVAALIAQGLTSREIAERLVVTERTVDTHADHIRTKLGLRSRAEIAAWAARHGLGDTHAPVP